jgi:hypothetical protein
MLVSNRKDIAATTAKRNSRTQKKKGRKDSCGPALLFYVQEEEEKKRQEETEVTPDQAAYYLGPLCCSLRLTLLGVGIVPSRKSNDEVRDVEHDTFEPMTLTILGCKLVTDDMLQLTGQELT